MLRGCEEGVTMMVEREISNDCAGYIDTYVRFLRLNSMRASRFAEIV